MKTVAITDYLSIRLNMTVQWSVLWDTAINSYPMWRKETKKSLDKVSLISQTTVVKYTKLVFPIEFQG